MVLSDDNRVSHDIDELYSTHNLHSTRAKKSTTHRSDSCVPTEATHADTPKRPRISRSDPRKVLPIRNTRISRSDSCEHTEATHGDLPMRTRGDLPMRTRGYDQSDPCVHTEATRGDLPMRTRGYDQSDPCGTPKPPTDTIKSTKATRMLSHSHP